MKKTTTFFLMGICAMLITLFSVKVNGQVTITAHNVSVNTNFNGWNGTMPNGFVRSANNNYMGTTVSTAGGVYAIPNMGFGYQPSSNQTAQTTSVTGTFVNNTGTTITELKVTYDAFKIEHRDARIPCWTVNVSLGVFGTNLNWCSDQPNATKTFTSPVNIANGASFTITLNSDRGTGSQSSPMIGFNNIKVESIQAACTPPDAPTSEPQFFCGEATVNELFADGENIRWYDAPDANTALNTSLALQTGTYYATQTVNNCESEKTPVEVTVTEIPAAPIAQDQSFCGEATVADLVAEGTDLQWFDAIDSVIALTDETELISGTYFVEQSENGCKSERTSVEITINEIPAAPEAQDQSFCGEATVADLVAEGTNLQWFDAIDSVIALNDETELTSGTYFVEQSENGCKSERTSVEITINEIPAAPEAQDQSFCGEATVADLIAEGTDIQWFDAIDAVTALTDETELISGTYFVEQSENGCKSERTSVEITINEIPAAPEAQDQSFCGEATVADLVAEGTDLQWFDAIDAEDALPVGTILENGTYYVSQSSNNCESIRIPIEVFINEIPAAPIAVTVQQFEEGATLADLEVEGENLTWYDEEGNELDPSTLLVDGEVYYVSQTVNGCESETIGIETDQLSINESDFVNLNVYPNPVQNILYISNSDQIENIMIFNLSGQLILEKKTNSKSVQVDLSHLSSATYIVKVILGNQFKTFKIIKK